MCMVLRRDKPRKPDARKSRSMDKKNSDFDGNLNTIPKYGFFQRAFKGVKTQSIFKGDSVEIRPGLFEVGA